MPSHQKELVTQPLSGMNFSPGFNRFAEANGFSNLDEILSFGLSTLLKRKGFDSHVQQELVEWLADHQLLQLLKQS